MASTGPSPIAGRLVEADPRPLVPGTAWSNDPGAARFQWDDLVEGALGTVVLADTRRVEDSFPALDYFEEREAPFVLAVNKFPGAQHFELEEVREALGLEASVPVVACDARDRGSVRDVLVALMDQVVERHIRTNHGSPALAR